MNQEHYTQIRTFRVYALLLHAEETFAYIGKTKAKNYLQYTVGTEPVQ